MYVGQMNIAIAVAAERGAQLGQMMAMQNMMFPPNLGALPAPPGAMPATAGVAVEVAEVDEGTPCVTQ